MIQMPLRIQWIVVWQEIQAWKVFETVFLPQVVWYATHHSLEDQSGCSRLVQNACLWLSIDGV